MKRFLHITLCALCFVASALSGYAQTEPPLQLDSIVVSSTRKEIFLKDPLGHATRVNLDRIEAFPSLLGNADPVRFAQMLPSMQSTSELDAGIHIQGCEHQHNLIALDGIPIYGATHLMGLFSVFNPSHFKSMTYSTAAVGENRLGGLLDMQTQVSAPHDWGVDASLGLISVQGTIRAPLGKKAGVLLSARRSLLDLFFGNAIQLDKITMGYRFSDYNGSFIWHPTSRDRVSLDFYYGGDRLHSSTNELGLDLHWNNLLAALKWDRGAFRQALYYTGCTLDLALDEQGKRVLLPSRIGTAGYKGSWEKSGLQVKADIAMHHIRPQSPTVEDSGIDFGADENLHAWENSVSVSWNDYLDSRFHYTAGMGAQWYVSPEGKSYFGLSPQLAGTYSLPGDSRLQLRTGIRHQYLFQTGLSNIGFPSEFWLPAGKYSKPQWTVEALLSYEKSWMKGQWSFSAELYYRHLGNQLDYTGGVMEFLDGSYTLQGALQRGSGRNYGLNLMFSKPVGRFTGWVAFSAGRSLRSFAGETRPSDHERLVELNVVASYRVGQWDFGGSFICAGGTPFSEPQEYYLVGSQLVAVFNGQNNGRLEPYVRLDLNTRFHFRSRGRLQHGLNLSVYNVLARKQEMYRTIECRRRLVQWNYKSIYLGISIIPSISYYLKF